MKNFLLALTAITVCSCASIQQKREVPDHIAAAFKELHPNATILKWNDEPPIWEAKYKEKTQQGAVSFNTDAHVVETELVIEESELPNEASIKTYIETHYPAEKIKGCEKIETQDHAITYEIQITGKELVFDASGSFVKEELD